MVQRHERKHRHVTTNLMFFYFGLFLFVPPPNLPHCWLFLCVCVFSGGAGGRGMFINVKLTSDLSGA